MTIQIAILIIGGLISGFCVVLWYLFTMLIQSVKELGKEVSGMRADINVHSEKFTSNEKKFDRMDNRIDDVEKDISELKISK